MEFVSTPKQYVDAVEDCAAHIGSCLLYTSSVYNIGVDLSGVKIFGSFHRQALFSNIVILFIRDLRSS